MPDQTIYISYGYILKFSLLNSVVVTMENIDFSNEESIMQSKIHMKDQVSNRVESIMEGYSDCSSEMWTLKAMAVLVIFMLLGIDW